ncbi:unnamed protein product [Schistosoma margrebowiei]|uniref:Uncharacterized protein n=1 Tax=Schistosoma margrebowiei TaxID=48269 RepID=A0A183NCL8_9TREM|nr:unnamed protein product [Schistosoma margrebowiei]
MKTSTSDEKRGIQWTAQNQLDGLNFADDLALRSHTKKQMQIKTTSVAEASKSLGLNIHKAKIMILKYKTENINSITLDAGDLELMETFKYLRSIVDKQGGSDAVVKTMIGKTRTAFLQLKNIC